MDIVTPFINMGWIAALCFSFGLLLVIFEMFIPGFGAPGVMGLMLLVAGVILTAKNIQEVLFLVFLILIILGTALAITLRSATKGRLSKSLILSNSLKKEAGYSGTEDLSSFLTKEGTAISVLRPAGTADFNGVKLDVVSEAEFIPKGAKLIVIKVEGRKVVVRELK